MGQASGRGPHLTPHLIYAVQDITDTADAFYSCSDVAFS